MRKTIFAFVAILLLTTFSCKKDKDEVTIVGKWTLNSASAKYYENGSSTPSEEDSYDPNDGPVTWTFNTDGTITEDAGGDVTTITYDYNSDKKTLSTKYSTGEAYIFTVKELSANTLSLYDEYNDTDEDNVAYRITIDYIFKR